VNGSAAPSEPPRYCDFSLNRFQAQFPEIFYLANICRQFRGIKMVLEENVTKNGLKLLLQNPGEKCSIREIFTSNSIPIVARCAAKTLSLCGGHKIT